MRTVTRERHNVSIILLSIVASAQLLVSGCTSSLPTAGEFQKEPTPTAKSSTGTKTTAKTPTGKIEGREIYENRDPFKPLFGQGSTTQTVTTTTTGPTGQVQATSVQVQLVSITGSTATINVNGTDYPNIKVGDTFADVFKLLSIGPGSVVILYGDNQYTLYLGETITVK